MNDKVGLQAPWTGDDYAQLDSLAKGTNYLSFFTTSQEMAKKKD
jgi:hypothetical protein